MVSESILAKMAQKSREWKFSREKGRVLRIPEEFEYRGGGTDPVRCRLDDPDDARGAPDIRHVHASRLRSLLGSAGAV